MKLGMISLGCAKNRIDTELFLGLAKKYNLTITSQMEEADILVVNTCGFIESAKKESIETILELCEYKNKKIVVMGCLVERYYEDLKNSIPEVDFYIPIRDYKNLDQLFNELTNQNNSYKLDYTSRVITTLPHSAYLRIGDGCNNKCAYCAIPLIRGSFKSREFNDIINEAKYLAEIGVKEITLIAQDTTRYGTDIYDKSCRVEHLLREIAKIESIKTIRLLYLYPDEITNELIEEIKNNSKVTPYFDIPIQHSSNKLLKSMNRRGTKEEITNLIEYIRKEIPNAIIRSTLIVGFPGETYYDYIDLRDFIIKIKFDRLGIFTYSDEEDTAAYSMDKKVSSKTSEKRYLELMKIQEQISYENNRKYINTIQKCIIDSFDHETNMYIGRNYAYAPDDVDGAIYITSDEELIIGEFYDVHIYETTPYDLLGIIENKTKTN